MQNAIDAIKGTDKGLGICRPSSVSLRTWGKLIEAGTVKASYNVYRTVNGKLQAVACDADTYSKAIRYAANPELFGFVSFSM